MLNHLHPLFLMDSIKEYITIPEATPQLSDLTLPYIGISTMSSHISCMAGVSPTPSSPKTKSVFGAKLYVERGTDPATLST